MLTIKYYLDKVLETYSSGSYYEQVKEAKAEFFDRAGRVAEGSEKFETQMNAFLDWYLFDRPLNREEIAPVKLFVLEKVEKLEPNEQGFFRDLTETIHSLFEVLKVKNSEIFVRDLFDREKYVVDETEINMGFSKGDIFQTRLIQFKDSLVFGNAFVFHPKESRSFVLKEIKKIKYMDNKQRLKLMHRLAVMKLKLEQYPHINVENIYTEEPLF